MFRAKYLSKATCLLPTRSAFTSGFVNGPPQRRCPSISSKKFYCSKDEIKKVSSDTLRLKDCKPVDINPSEPKKRIPSIQECRNDLGGLSQPDGSSDGNNRNEKGRSKIIIGLIVAAVAAGALYFVVLGRDKVQEPAAKQKKSKSVKKAIIEVRDPKESKDIPKAVPYLLIGGGTASFTAFRAIKSSEPTAKVLMISNESFYPYMRPPLSKEIWFNEDEGSVKNLMFRQWNGSERSLFYEPEDFYTNCKDLMQSENGGVAVARGWTVTRIDVMEKVAYLDDGTAIQYDKCLIATGATPRLPPVFRVAVTDENLKDRVKLFRNIHDFQDAHEAFEKAKSIAIVGGGFLGSELACAFGRKDKRKAKEIYQIFRESGNMGKILPEYLSVWTTEKVRAEGVNVIPSTEIVGIRDVNGAVQLTLNSGKTITIDFVLVSCGVEPNTELAEMSDLEVDPELGGYLVNTELQARTDVYAAGDCACFYDPKLGRRRIEHHDHSVVSGRLAGENMAGARKPYHHQSMFWSDLGPDVGYEAIGVVDSSLPTVGVFAKATEGDTPRAVVTESNEGDRSKTENLPQECEKFLSDEEKEKLKETQKSLAPKKNEGEDFGKGVVFYLRDDVVVGIVLWNVFNRMSIARQVLKDQRKYDDLNEVAKLFNIHENENNPD
ncbi:apoptosis-inducing factor 1, mitochondrial [Cylas formicarius]|uniref:apoptosis-inducing factor 1, mitochondrial n=1 Tax=Cylas formicarius TaxID=197179 RepID=UPI002958C9E4|nr:apoptosis-inducing factor 1, mitochondrial [Cylas formicarius]